jgi:hypothetical protein
MSLQVPSLSESRRRRAYYKASKWPCTAPSVAGPRPARMSDLYFLVTRFGSAPILETMASRYPTDIRERTELLREVTRVAAHLHRTRDELEVALLLAHIGGVSLRRLAAEAGLSHETVRKMVLSRLSSPHPP